MCYSMVRERKPTGRVVDFKRIVEKEKISPNKFIISATENLSTSFPIFENKKQNYKKKQENILILMILKKFKEKKE